MKDRYLGGAILVKINIGDMILKNTGFTVVYSEPINNMFYFDFIDFVGIR